jgi:hypothetical protein
MTYMRYDGNPWQHHRRLPASFWRRVAVLWGFAPAPFFDAFRDEEEMRLARIEDHLGTAEEG